MNATNELLAIAQIAVALAGFSGVVAAFFQQGGLLLADRIRFVGIFSVAFLALTLAFLPIALEHLGVGSRRLWSVSSFVMVVTWFVGFGMWGAVRRKVVTGLKVESSIPTAMLVIPAIVNLVVQIGNVGGWYWQPGFVAYLFGLLAILYAAGLGFVLAVLFRPVTDP